MEVFLFHPEEYSRLWNCSWYSVEAVPLEVRSRPYLGWGLIVLAALYILCYLPCAVALGRHLEHSCYKIMFVLAWWDLAALVTIGVASGYLAVRGMVFCSAPTLMLIQGAISYMFWLGASTLTILLALDRCMEMLAPQLAAALFEGRRTWCWLAASLSGAMVGCFFLAGFTFNSIYFSYFLNPHAGYYPQWYKDSSYYSSFHPKHNTVTAISLLVLYLLTLFGLKRKVKAVAPVATTAASKPAPVTFASAPSAAVNQEHQTQTALWQRRIYLQVMLICALNVSAAGLFVSFQFFAVPPWLIYTATYLYVSSHGVPGVIYLALNQTLRDDLNEMFSHAVRRMARIVRFTTIAATAPLNENNAEQGGGR